MPQVTRFQESDLRVLCLLMGPDYIIEAAKSYGDGDAVAGAPLAYSEVRTLVREYARFVRHRDGISGRDLNLALILRSLGWIPVGYKHVTPVQETDWQQTAKVFWPDGASMPGHTVVPVGSASQQDVNYAVITSTSEMLREHPSLNKAFLQGRIYQRDSRDSSVMVHVDLRGNIRSLVFDAAGKDAVWVKKKMARGMKALLRAEKDELARTLAGQMLRAWGETGFITSPAGAMISLVGDQGVPQGIAPLVPANGIPLTITVGKVEDGKVVLGLNGDHRVLNGRDMGIAYQYLQERVPQILGEARHEDNSVRWDVGNRRSHLQ